MTFDSLSSYPVGLIDVEISVSTDVFSGVTADTFTVPISVCVAPDPVAVNVVSSNTETTTNLAYTDFSTVGMDWPTCGLDGTH